MSFIQFWLKLVWGWYWVKSNIEWEVIGYGYFWTDYKSTTTIISILFVLSHSELILNHFFNLNLDCLRFSAASAHKTLVAITIIIIQTSWLISCRREPPFVVYISYIVTGSDGTDRDEWRRHVLLTQQPRQFTKTAFWLTAEMAEALTDKVNRCYQRS